MKSLKFFLILTLSVHLLSCEPPVTFTEPQPANTKNLNKFPNRIRGNYLSLADNSILCIDRNSIQRIYDYDYKIHPNELDSNSTLKGDTIIDPVTFEKTIIKRDGDSLITHVHYRDTLFLLSNDNILKKYKGYFFINLRYTDGNWEVKKIRLHKGQLTISSISTEIDLKNLEAITESPQDTVPPYTFTPTKKQFKKFVQQDGFSDEEVFVKQKKK